VAVSAVLASFMAGLAIGSLLAGGVLARGISPLAAFGAAETLIGVIGALSPSALDAARSAQVVIAASAVLFASVVRATPDPIRALFARRHGTEPLEMCRDEDPQTMVSVFGGRFRRVLLLERPAPGERPARDGRGAPRHRPSPIILHGHPREVLVIGLGGGATAGAASARPATRWTRWGSRASTCCVTSTRPGRSGCAPSSDRGRF
jgi:hypothetical protein